MKHVVLIGDGMGDYPRPELDGRTPLQAAATPNMDRLARSGLIGLSRTIPPGMEPGSDVANLSLMGYDPTVHHTGRAPLEAASLGIDLGDEEVAFRCNLVILGRDESGRPEMTDYASGHITTEAARPLVLALQEALGDGRFTFHPGTSYRHLLVWTGGREDLELTPPHDLTGRVVAEQLDKLAVDSPDLFELTVKSWDVLAKAAAEAGLSNPPTSIWLWGQGKPPKLATMAERFGVSGAVISAVDLLKGLGVYAGLEPIEVAGATGWLDTNYAGKVEAGLKALAEMDFLYLHVEAPDEAGHTGVLENKIKAIEDFDARVVGPLVEGLGRLDDFRVLLACDHFTPLEVMTHTPEPVPVLFYDSRRAWGAAPAYCEASAAEGEDFGPAHGLLERLLAD